MEWEGFDFKGLSSIVGYRYLWKGVELLTILILARLLSITDFGIAFLAISIVYLVQSFMKLSYREKDAQKIKKFYNALSIVSPLTGSIVAGIMFLLSISFLPSQYVEAIRLSAVIILFSSFIFTPETFFFNRNELKKIYRSYAIAQIFMSILTISLALSGLGYKAVLYGYIVFYLGNTVMLWELFPFKLKASVNKELLNKIFSTWKENLESISISVLLYYGVLFYTVIVFGLTEFAVLFMAFTLGYFLYENITIFINSLIIPKFIEFEETENNDAFRYNLVRVLEYFSLKIVPVSLIMIVLARQIMNIGFLWDIGVDILTLILFAGMLKAICETTRIVFISKARLDIIERIKYLELLILLVGLVIFVKFFGFFGVGLAVMISSVLASLMYLFVGAKITRLNLITVSRDYFYIIFSGLTAALFVGLAKELFFIRTLSSLVILIILGELVYLGVSFVFNKELYRRFVKFIFNLMGE